MRLRGRRAVWSGAGAVVVVSALVAFVLTREGGPTAVASSTTAVQRGTVTLEVAAAGTVQSSQTQGLSFSVAGTVTEVNVKPGDTVAIGQVLARVDPAEAQAAVDSAQSRVDDAEDAVDRAESAAQQTTCQTTPAATTRPPTASPTTKAPPSSTPSTSPSPSGRQPAPYSALADAAPAATQNDGAGGQSGPQTCAPSGRTSTSDSQLSAAQQLNNAKLSLARAKTRLAGTVISAPIAGRVLSVDGKVGSKASPGGTGFVVLGDVSTVAVKAQFSEADVGRLAVGQVSSIRLPDRTEAFPGKVSQIDPAGTVSSRLVRYSVVIAFDAVPVDLLLGQSSTVMVTTASVDNVLFVASAAVTGVADGVGTVTVRDNGREATRTVKVGLRGDQYTEISDGLAQGDEVVLPGA